MSPNTCSGTAISSLAQIRKWSSRKVHERALIISIQRREDFEDEKGKTPILDE